MAVSIKYKTLFKLDILHHFFLSGGATNKEYGLMSASEKKAQEKYYTLSDFFEIIPDRSTLDALRGYKQIYKSGSNGFQVLVSVDEDDKPVIDIAEKAKWTFGLVLKDANFWNYSAIRLEPSFDDTNSLRNNIPRVFYYSNNSSGITAPNLSKDVPAFSGAATYKMNDLVIHAGLMYEAVKNAPAGANPAAAGAEWQNIDIQSFTTHLDELRYRPSMFNYRFSQADIWAALELKNLDGDSLNKEHGGSSTENMLYPINLTGFTPGAYTLEVNGNAYADSQTFYYNSEFQSKPLFGVIEIFHETGLAAGLNLLDGDDKVVEQSFELRFKNRLTQWRYKDSTDLSTVGSINGISNALPLTSNGYISSVDRNSKKLPNAAANIVTPESDAIYSDIFIDSNQYPL